MEANTQELTAMPVQTTSLLNVANLMPAARENRRDVRRALDEAKAIVTVDEESAKECFYSLPRGGKKISGPSIGLAETLASTWGNLVLSCDGVEEHDDNVVIRGWIIDTQSGLGTQDMVRRRILDRNGNRYNSDMLNTTIAAARSILYRNLVLRVIPRPHVRHVYRAACNVAMGEGDTWTERVVKLIEFWEKKGITKERLLIHLQKSRKEDIDYEDVEYLLGIEQSIRAGDTDIEKIFSPATKEATAPPRKERAKKTKGAKTEPEHPQEPAPTEDPVKFGPDEQQELPNE